MDAFAGTSAVAARKARLAAQANNLSATVLTSDDAVQENSVAEDTQFAQISSAPLSRDSSQTHEPPSKRQKVEHVSSPDEAPAFIPLKGVNIAYCLKNGQRSAILFGLQADESIAAFGTYQLTVLQGSVTIASALRTPLDDPLDVIAPLTHTLPVISAAFSSASSAFDLSTLNLERDMSEGNFQQTCLIKLEPLCNGLFQSADIIRRSDFVKRHSAIWRRHFTHPSIEAWSLYDATDRGGFELLYEQPPVEASLYKSIPSWESALNEMTAKAHDRLCVLAEGSKSSGKSTFNRTCLNTLLNQYTQVAFLDLNPGQSEFNPSGALSLHVFDEHIIAPAFASHRQALASHYLGSTTPLSDPIFYMDAIQTLKRTYDGIIPTPQNQRCSKISKQTPLIINTCGWTKGTGRTLQQSIRDLFNPTHHFHLSTNENEEGLARLDAYIALDNAPVRMTPSQSRSLSFLSYLHFDMQTKTWDFDKPLSTRLPIVCQWNKALARVLIPHASVTLQHALFAFNGSAVALIATSEEQPELPSTLPYQMDSGEVDRPSLAHSRCLGMAFIRATNVAKQSFHLITPVPVETLKEVNCLYLGQNELPLAAYLDVDLEPSHLPYLREDGFSAGKRHIRRNVQRRYAA